MYVCMYVCVYACTYASVCVCVCVCTCVCIHLEYLGTFLVVVCAGTIIITNVKVRNIFCVRSNVTCNTNCKYRIAATPYPINMVCFRYIIVNQVDKKMIIITVCRIQYIAYIFHHKYMFVHLSIWVMAYPDASAVYIEQVSVWGLCSSLVSCTKK
jgi:hypothetical protein